MTVAGFCGSVPVISYGNDNSLIGMGHRNFPKVLIYETGNIARICSAITARSSSGACAT